MKLQVIGAGLGRTGTLSLKMALEELGFGPCFHMIELLKNHERTPFLTNKNGPVWDKLLEGFQSSVDYPTCLYYKELLAENPEAKVVLTVRDFDNWHKSVSETIYKSKPQGFTGIVKMLFNIARHKELRKRAPIFMHNDKLIWDGQFESKFEDKAKAIEIHKAHIEAVKAHVPASQLLVFEVKDGWVPLCNFLGVPIPDTPFPRSNSKSEINQKIDKLMNKGQFEW